MAFGILFATVITLILIPSLYAILEHMKYRFIKVDGYQRKGEPTAPAV
ncbi:Acriflavin resistance protein [hydrothermal vent metagenome]|uniref:Acriflavin resistance protein n=1 Tax=hydrothermal vent metagenome TaxID=652676 RepID=A0A3B0VUX1_9ZZZZ